MSSAKRRQPGEWSRPAIGARGALVLAMGGLLPATTSAASHDQSARQEKTSQETPARPRITAAREPLVEGDKGLTLKVEPFDANTQWLGACLGGDRAGKPAWSAVPRPKSSSPGEFEVSFAPDGLPLGKSLRACVMPKDGDVTTACQESAACADFVAFPKARFGGTLMEARSAFDLTFPPGPWRAQAEALSVELRREGESFLGLPLSLPGPEEPQHLTVRVADLGTPTALHAGDKVIVSILRRQGAAARSEAVVSERLIRRAEVTLGTKTVLIVFGQPGGAKGETAPVLQLSVPGEPLHTISDDQRKQGQAIFTLTRPRLATEDGHLLVVTLRARDSKTEDVLAVDEATVQDLPPQVQIWVPLKEGQSEVAGVVTAAFASVALRRLAADRSTVLETGLQPVQNGTFKASLKGPLAEGDVVRVCPVANTDPPQAIAIGCDLAAVAPVSSDLGRVTAVFSLGTLFTQSKPGKSGLLDSVSPYVALRVDTIWLNHLKKRDGNGGATGWGWALQTFFEARLTEAGTIAETTNGAGGLLSKRAGLFQGGFFAPILPNLGKSRTWQDRGEDDVLFVAPILKLGFQSIKDGYALRFETDGKGDALTIKKDADGNRVPAETSVIAPFWGVGLRLAFSQLRAQGRSTGGQRSRVPRPIDYVDFVVGRFENYREVDDKSGGTKASMRLAVEGRLAMPGLPLEIGFDVNLLLKHLEKIPHDYRVFLNVRFDAASALRKVFGPSPK